MRTRVFTKSPVRENCTPGSVRGLSGNWQSYRDLRSDDSSSNAIPMKLHATVNDRQTDIQIRDDGGRVFAEIDDRRYELDVHESGASGYLLISDGQVFDCRVEGRPESGKPVAVIVGTTPCVVTLRDPKRLSSAASASSHGDDTARIVAPMPGKVVRVLVEVGSQVEAGASIIVIEAMKMQNEMKSPKAGTVIALNIQTGATVNGGDVLAIVE